MSENFSTFEDRDKLNDLHIDTPAGMSAASYLRMMMSGENHFDIPENTNIPEYLRILEIRRNLVASNEALKDKNSTEQ